jgi:hypothetical protein
MRTFFLVIGVWVVCGTTAVGQVTAYSNNTTNEGFTLLFDATTASGNTSTQLYADDITVAPSSVGMVVSQFQLGIRNQNPPLRSRHGATASAVLFTRRNERSTRHIHSRI